MTLLDLLKTCNNETAIRIHFGKENKYFDINSKDKDAFIAWLEWIGVYDEYIEGGDVEAWHIAQIGKTLNEQRPVLFIKLK